MEDIQEENAPVEEAGITTLALPGGRIDPSKLDLREEVVSLNRVAKVVKGGRRFSFAALVVIGDGRGHVGVGFGKAKEVPDSIQKGVEAAKKSLIHVPLVGRTVPHEYIGEYSAARVMVKPASEGTGLIAGPAARAVLELCGVRDALTKVLGSNNQLNVVKATFDALRRMSLADRVADLRGKSLEELLGKQGAERYRTGREEAIAHTPDFTQIKAQERSRRGTYSAGGRRDEASNEEGGGES